MVGFPISNDDGVLAGGARPVLHQKHQKTIDKLSCCSVNLIDEIHNYEQGKSCGCWTIPIGKYV